MDPRDGVATGDVAGTIELLKQEVRKSPRDPRVRTFLFQMFCISGEWDRALTQLSVLAELDPVSIPMARTYEIVVRCELLREKVLRGERSPIVLGDPGPWLPLLIEAIRLLAAEQADEALTLREQAFELASISQGSIDGTPFEWIADGDPRLGPVLEVIVNGSYMWAPFDRLLGVSLQPPADLRDQVWMPAHFTWSNGGEADGFIPTRYPGSAGIDQPDFAFARRTEWREVAPGWEIPVGQRVLVTDARDVALMDLRQLAISPGSAGADSSCPA